MAKVTLPTLGSFHKDDIHLVRGENENVPLLFALSLMKDTRFVVEFEEGEDVTAALAGKSSAAEETDLNGVPKDKTYRLSLIAGAMLFTTLNSDDYPEAITSTGKIDARHLTKLLGWQVTAVDRDEALSRSEKGTIEPIDFDPNGHTAGTDPEPGVEDDQSDLLPEPDQDTTKEETAPKTPIKLLPKTKGAVKLSSKKSSDGTNNPVAV